MIREQRVTSLSTVTKPQHVERNGRHFSRNRRVFGRGGRHGDRISGTTGATSGETSATTRRDRDPAVRPRERQEGRPPGDTASTAAETPSTTTLRAPTAATGPGESAGSNIRASTRAADADGPDSCTADPRPGRTRPGVRGSALRGPRVASIPPTHRRQAVDLAF